MFDSIQDLESSMRSMTTDRHIKASCSTQTRGWRSMFRYIAICSDLLEKNDYIWTQKLHDQAYEEFCDKTGKGFETWT